MLTAVADVETALASIARDNERVAALDTAAAKSRSAADQVRRAWRAGEFPILICSRLSAANFPQRKPWRKRKPPTYVIMRVCSLRLVVE
jgi:hypothetical protein